MSDYKTDQDRFFDDLLELAKIRAADERERRLIQFSLPPEAYRRLSAHPAFPRKRKGERNIRNFYRQIFVDYMESADFKLKEAQRRLSGAERELKQARSSVDAYSKLVAVMRQREKSN